MSPAPTSVPGGPDGAATFEVTEGALGGPLDTAPPHESAAHENVIAITELTTRMRPSI
jgi:hypothetical protein